MGRRKIKIEKLQGEQQRKMAFRKRREGLLKKANDLSVLADAQVFLMMLSSTGSKIDHFSSRPGTWKILQRYIQNMSENERENLQISQNTINTINTLAEQHDLANQSGPDAPDRKEIEREIIDDETKLKLLQLQNKMLSPGMEAFNSDQEFSNIIQGLQNINIEQHESRQHSYNASLHKQMQRGDTDAGPAAGMPGPLHVFRKQNPSSSLSVQRRVSQQKEVQVFGADYPSSSSSVPRRVPLQTLMQRPQAAPGPGMWVPLRGKENTRQQGVQVFGADNTSSCSTVPRQIPMRQLRTALGPGTWRLLQQREHIQQQELLAFGMENVSLDVGAQKNVQIPTSMSEQKNSEPVPRLYDDFDFGDHWWEDILNENGRREYI